MTVPQCSLTRCVLSCTLHLVLPSVGQGPSRWDVAAPPLRPYVALALVMWLSMGSRQSSCIPLPECNFFSSFLRGGVALLAFLRGVWLSSSLPPWGCAYLLLFLCWGVAVFFPSSAEVWLPSSLPP